MTEAEWLACAKPDEMRRFALTKASVRQMLLYTAAGCRCSWPATRDRRSWNAVELAEKYADRLVSYAEFCAVGEVLVEAVTALMGPRFKADHATHAAILRDVIGNPFRP